MRLLSWEPVDLVTTLSRPECVSRLRQTLRPRWSLSFSGPIAGWAGERSFRMRKRIWYGNSFQAIVAGRLSDDDKGGTRIHCAIRMNLFVQGFVAIWLLVFGFISIAVALASTREQ